MEWGYSRSVRAFMCPYTGCTVTPCSPTQTFEKAAEFGIKYHRLAAPLATVSFEEREGLAVCACEPVAHPKIDDQLYRFITEVYIATHLSLHRDVMGQTFRPRETSMAVLLDRLFTSARAQSCDSLGATGRSAHATPGSPIKWPGCFRSRS